MKANRLAWILLLSLLNCGCNAQSSPLATTNLTALDLANKLPSTNDVRSDGSGMATTPNAETASDIYGLSDYEVGLVKEDIAETKAKAEKGDRSAQYRLAWSFQLGFNTKTNIADAITWYRKAAEQDHAAAEDELGQAYYAGQGVPVYWEEAAKWFRKAAEQNLPAAQYALARAYALGQGVPQDFVEAYKWANLSAAHGNASSTALRETLRPQMNIEQVAEAQRRASEFRPRVALKAGASTSHSTISRPAGSGTGSLITEDGSKVTVVPPASPQQGKTPTWEETVPVEVVPPAKPQQKKTNALDFLNAPEDVPPAEPKRKSRLTILEGMPAPPSVSLDQSPSRSTPEHTTSNAFSEPPLTEPSISAVIAAFGPTATGTGFLLTDDGFLVTSAHVIADASEIRLVTGHKFLTGRVVKVDTANDLALLKTEGSFVPLAVIPSKGIRLGSVVATVGFPNLDMQGLAPKLAKGDVASLSGARDDPRYFQISVPLQPGNSGGALVDEKGNVVGVVAAKLDVVTAIAHSGNIPENVNYAVKSSFLLGLLEAVPEVSAKLKEANTNTQKFDDVASTAERAAVLVLCRTKPQSTAPALENIFPRRYGTTPVRPYVGTTVSIESVIDDGNYIKMYDGSLWEVSPVDASDSSSWTASSDIMVLESKDPAYPYKLVNTDDKESVNARRVR